VLKEHGSIEAASPSSTGSPSCCLPCLKSTAPLKPGNQRMAGWRDGPSVLKEHGSIEATERLLCRCTAESLPCLKSTAPLKLGGAVLNPGVGSAFRA